LGRPNLPPPAPNLHEVEAKWPTPLCSAIVYRVSPPRTWIKALLTSLFGLFHSRLFAERRAQVRADHFQVSLGETCSPLCIFNVPLSLIHTFPFEYTLPLVRYFLWPSYPGHNRLAASKNYFFPERALYLCLTEVSLS